MYTAMSKQHSSDALLSQHAGLVKKMAYQLKAKLPANVEMDDLIQAGMIGLLDATQRYEDNHGAQFETYASLRIRGAMLDELRENDWMPRSLRKSMRAVESAIRSLEQQYGRAPTETELAKALDMTITEYHALLGDCSGHQLLYFEDFHASDESAHFLDHHVHDQHGDPMQMLLSSDFKDCLVEAINALPEREKILMGLYYEQSLNLKEIGTVMNVSESRVSQLHSQAVARLRASMKEMLWTGVA